jgi:hypothetical protein
MMAHAGLMRTPAVVFTHTGLTVHASRSSLAEQAWRGELLNEHGLVEDVFAYTREHFPGAVIGALRVPDVAFATQLAARMWVFTDEHEAR